MHLSLGKCSAKTSGTGKCMNVLRNPITAETTANPMKSNTLRNTETKR